MNTSKLKEIEYGNVLPFPNQTLVFMCQQYTPFENTVGKGEFDRNEQFLLFPQCFLSNLGSLPFLSNLKLLSANPFSLEASKICCFGRVKLLANSGKISTRGRKRIEQILLFSQCLQKDLVCGHNKNSGLLGKGLNYESIWR